MADVSTWNFSPDSAFLVGPIVGRVTANTARMMVEASANSTASISVMSDGKSAGGAAVTGVTADAASTEDVNVAVASSMEVQLTAKKPAAIELTGLQPGKRVTVNIKIGAETRTASFTTPDPARRDWHVGLVSCNKISTMKEIALWEKLAKAAPSMDVMLHMGDQVYGDEDFHRGGKNEAEIDTKQEAREGCWGRCKEIVTAPDVGTNWEPLREQCRDIYANLYRATWSHPPTASALAAVSNLMVLDDHEIVDDTGDVPEHLDSTTWQFFVMGCAYQAYLAYQGQLNFPIKDLEDMEQKVYYHTHLFPNVGLVMCDVRLQRSLHRHQQSGADWTDHEYLGPRQFVDLKAAMEDDFKDCTSVIVVSPTPLLFVSSAAASLIVHASDDIIGSWSNKKFKHEQKEFLQVSAAVQAQHIGINAPDADCIAGTRNQYSACAMASSHGYGDGQC
eukprot:TRINITY_DN6439_c0_g1_i2.p1 TRINITY_DN6439_c0_g1~~TRINITY_DN6439_c0_g1_i2.p1  ORF type:complete len:476 (+),score=151.65 TRINITY_DN6439_c0_g1_i2:85-1428(+)